MISAQSTVMIFNLRSFPSSIPLSWFKYNLNALVFSLMSLQILVYTDLHYDCYGRTEMTVKLFKVLKSIKLNERVAWKNNWVILKQWDINAPLGFSDCLPASFFINCPESGHPRSPGDLRLIKAKLLLPHMFPKWSEKCTRNV